jgi:hypothetical protein
LWPSSARTERGNARRSFISGKGYALRVARRFQERNRIATAARLPLA